MTRSSQITQALREMRNGRAGNGARSAPASMKFVIFMDNGGDYGWALVAADGKRLAQSPRFSS